MQKMGIIKFYTDMDKWVLPISLQLNLVGNNHRPYNLIISFLCFSLIVCIDEDARQKMGMSIDKLIVFCEDLEKYHSTRCKRYDDASGYTRSRNEKIRTNDAKREEMDSKFYQELKKIVRKYQKIVEIMDDKKDDGGAFEMEDSYWLDKISEVLNGTDNS